VIIELNASANMFYLLKHLMLLNFVVFKLKCNNLTFNEILSLYDSYVCLLHSRFIKNRPIWILEDGPLLSEVVLSQGPSCPASERPTGSRPWRHQKGEKNYQHTVKSTRQSLNK
jgi:hypothetical protein